MSATPGGDDAVRMELAIIAGGTFPPPGVAGTQANRELWDAITADIAALQAGVIPDVPADWTGGG